MFTFQPGEAFDRRYRIVRELGRGGFAVVYLAEHIEIGHQVAIKFLDVGRSDARFVREGRVLAQLRSEYTVRLLDFGRTDDAHPFIVCDYVDGTPLDEIARRGAIAPARVLRWVSQVLASLAEAHALGIVHRDLKPANLFVTAADDVRVLDFGIAKFLPGAPAGDAALTNPGFAIGTPAYMAPEQLVGARIVPATDLFALGLIAWELLFGEPANDSRDRRRATARQFGRRYSFAGAAVSAALIDFFDTLVAQNVRRRPADGAVALEQLRELWRPSPQDAVVPAPPSSRPTPPAADATSSTTRVDTPRGKSGSPSRFAAWPDGFCWTVGGRIYWSDGKAQTEEAELPSGFDVTCLAPTAMGAAAVGSSDGRVTWTGGSSDTIAIDGHVTAIASGATTVASTLGGAVFRVAREAANKIATVDGDVAALAIARAGDMIAIGLGERVQIHDTRSGAQRAMRDIGASVRSVAYSPDDYLLAILTAEELIVASALTLDSMVRFQNNRGEIVAIRFTRAGQLETAVLVGDELHIAPVD